VLTIVPRRVTQTDADVSIAAFWLDETPPTLRLHVTGQRPQPIADWRTIPGGDAQPIFCSSLQLTDLSPNTRYELSLRDGPRELARAQLCTLPTQLPRNEHGGGSARPFTLWLSSCFGARQSPPGLREVVQQLFDDSHAAPHLKCLVGDQVYLDELWLFIYSALTRTQLCSRFNRQYAQTFTHPGFARLLSAGANLFLPDDHELWNNFPHEPLGFPLRARAFWERWYRLAFEERYLPLQGPIAKQPLHIGRDLSLFVADMRTGRSRDGNRLMSEGGYAGVASDAGDMDRLVRWLEQLRCPGVLITQQPLISGRGTDADHRPPDYRQYWRRLLPALHACPQDLVVLAGDVHHGHVCSTQLQSGRRLIQVVASPLSLVSPLAAAMPEREPRWFPAAERGEQPSPVQHHMQVPAYRAGRSLRSEEHGMTIAFWRRDDHSLGMRVQTHLVRAASDRTGPSWQTVLRGQTSTAESYDSRCST